jgi:regulator of nucleoside diphosphate kinase
MNKKRLITDSDRCRLGSLLTSSEYTAWGNPQSLSKLNSRLESAVPIGTDQTPRDLVTMNSTVLLTDEASGEDRQVTVAYPQDDDFVRAGVSVLEPLGLELLGSEVGDIVRDNRKEFRVANIVFQPEMAGARHL